MKKLLAIALVAVPMVAFAGPHCPEIDAARTHLREAKVNLEKAKHDFAGHRAKALESVNAALAEVNQAAAVKQCH